MLGMEGPIAEGEKARARAWAADMAANVEGAG